MRNFGTLNALHNLRLITSLAFQGCYGNKSKHRNGADLLAGRGHKSPQGLSMTVLSTDHSGSKTPLTVPKALGQLRYQSNVPSVATETIEENLFSVLRI